jgi:hypothetical protein
MPLRSAPVTSAQGGGSEADAVVWAPSDAYGQGRAGRFDRFDGVRRGARRPGRASEAADHEGDEGPGDVGLAVGAEPLVVADVSPGSHDPQDGPLDTPPLGEYGESALVLPAGHRLEGDARGRSGTSRRESRRRRSPPRRRRVRDASGAGGTAGHGPGCCRAARPRVTHHRFRHPPLWVLPVGHVVRRRHPGPRW